MWGEVVLALFNFLIVFIGPEALHDNAEDKVCLDG